MRSLNTIFSRWGISAGPSWNIRGEPCNGVATDYTIFDVEAFNPLIKCDCTFNNNTLCHIIKLKVYQLNVVGPIPDELSNLKFLENIILAGNFLTHSLPAFIGNFSGLEYFTVGYNSLSGTIPKELGNLRRLISIGLNANKFNGSLPPEFGNLVNIELLYIDSSGPSGEIPSTFVNLQKLKIWWASDNNFSGKIPNFIGNLTNLSVLRFQGNSFEGPIPESFANLTKLTDLRIGDLTSGNSSLDFIRDMSSLNILIIRNSKISGSLPSDMGKYMNLVHLDLSFNNLTGLLPQSLFNLSSLAYLFLGNNSFSCGLTSQKSTNLLNIDLSYNDISGSFPSWVGDNNMQLNMVANNFVVDGSNNSVLPSGLNCLQKSISCSRGSPIFRWAISSAGKFLDVSNPSYIWNSLSQVTNTSDPELFQSARHSPSSLRYYGLGLENGNYTITLDFAEIALDSVTSLKWTSLGRRIFDIYIQGNIVAKDFDIRKEAGGNALTTVEKEYRALVTDNFLEIHFFWAGKGTCCIPFLGYYGPSISAIRVSPNFIPTVSNRPPTIASKKTKNKSLIAGTIVGAAALCSLLVFGLIWSHKRRQLSIDDDHELVGLAVKPDTFSYTELRNATEDFNPANKLGEGGFGSVFKGKLSDGRVVAVKQLSVASLQGKRQFV